jgi:mannose-6-phosphate isomerase-like protein (cupin superfamily)
MRDWWAQLRRGPVLPALPVCTLVVLVAVRFAPSAEPLAPKVYSMRGAALPASPLADVPIGVTAGSSAHHLRLLQDLKPQLHHRHDATIVVLAGRGRFTVGLDTVDVEPGTVVLVPRGTVYSVSVGSEPVEAVAVFTPRFDGTDRVFVHD